MRSSAEVRVRLRARARARVQIRVRATAGARISVRVRQWGTVSARLKVKDVVRGRVGGYTVSQGSTRVEERLGVGVLGVKARVRATCEYRFHPVLCSLAENRVHEGGGLLH